MQVREIITEVSEEFKAIVETFNHLEYEVDRLFDNVERVESSYTATEAEMVVSQAVDGKEIYE